VGFICVCPIGCRSWDKAMSSELKIGSRYSHVLTTLLQIQTFSATDYLYTFLTPTLLRIFANACCDSDEFTLPLNHKPLLQQVLKWKVAGNYQGTRSTPKHEMTWNGNSTEQGPGYRWVSPPSPVGWEIQEMLSPNVSKSTSIYVLQCCVHIGRVKSFH